MKNGRFKHTVAIVFLALFCSMKLAGLHVLSHTDDKEHAAHCFICDHAVTHNLTPALAADIPELNFERKVDVLFSEITDDYHFTYAASVFPDQLFSRPPPTI